jgi:hypothetical protein
MPSADYVIGIPSFQRAALLKTHTLSLLQKRAVPRERIFVYVNDAEAKAQYESVLDRETYNEVRIGAGPGVTAARNRISADHPDGAAVIQMDDDLLDVCRLVAPKTLDPILDLDSFFTWAFDELRRTGLTLWGISPTNNHFFMNGNTSTGLKFCIGQLYGVLNRQNEVLRAPSKEDYELSLLRYESDFGVLRFNWIGVKSAPFYVTPGGCSASSDRIQTDSDASDYLMARWPGLVRPNRTRKGPHKQINLVDPASRVRARG